MDYGGRGTTSVLFPKTLPTSVEGGREREGGREGGREGEREGEREGGRGREGGRRDGERQIDRGREGGDANQVKGAEEMEQTTISNHIQQN